MAEVLRELLAAVDAGSAVALATVVGSCGSVPRHAGSRMLVYASGTRSGSIGGGVLEERVAADALAALAARTPRLARYELEQACGGTVTVYLEPHLPAPQVLVVGCGHVGRAVVWLAHWLGFRVIAVDSDPAAVAEEALPGADVRLAGLAGQLPVSADTHVVVCTSSVESDAAALAVLLPGPARTIAVLGGARRWKATRAALSAHGEFPGGVIPPGIDRVRSPAGLDIGAQTPREIAVAIMAEIIAARQP